jgi:hypothetical protein
MDTILDPAFTSSPVSTGFPRETAALNAQWIFQIPATSPDLLPLTYSVSPTTGDTPKRGVYSDLLNGIPGSTYNNPMDFDTHSFSETGIIEWWPSERGLHAFQVLITDSNGMICPLDFIIDVIDLCS